MKALSLILLILCLYSCGSNPKDIYSFDPDCNKIIVDYQTPLYEDKDVIICKNTGTDAYVCYSKTCRKCTFDSVGSDKVQVGAFAGSMVYFDTDLPLDEAAKILDGMYIAVN